MIDTAKCGKRDSPRNTAKICWCSSPWLLSYTPFPGNSGCWQKHQLLRKTSREYPANGCSGPHGALAWCLAMVASACARVLTRRPHRPAARIGLGVEFRARVRPAISWQERKVPMPSGNGTLRGTLSIGTLKPSPPQYVETLFKSARSRGWHGLSTPRACPCRSSSGAEHHLPGGLHTM
jgi:hypothetical protein